MDYRRVWHRAAPIFFTVNLRQRKGSDLLVRHVRALREAVKVAKVRHPFEIHAWVVLPEHFHCVLGLLPDDADYATRLRLIKARFSKALPKTERRSAVWVRRGERGIWQRRYWEHLIRDEADYRAHLDYIHYNPVKHGWVKQTLWAHAVRAHAE
jgi:putative transposase